MNASAALPNPFDWSNRAMSPPKQREIKLTADERAMERDDIDDEWKRDMVARMIVLEDGVDEIKKNTDDVVEFVKALKVIHTLAKGITAIAAACAVIFVMWKSGGKP